MKTTIFSVAYYESKDATGLKNYFLKTITKISNLIGCMICVENALVLAFIK